MDRAVQFALTPDGVQIAYWTMGSGPPLIALDVPCFSHCRLELREKRFTEWHEGLAARHRLIRLDLRGTGASGRRPPELSLSALQSDILAVADALRLERFSLFARDGGVPAAVALAARRDSRIERLVLYNGWFDGAEVAIHETFAAAEQLAIRDWPFFCETLARVVIGAPDDQAAGVAAYVGACVELEDWLRYIALFRTLSVRDLLPRVECPTLVLHPGRNHVSSLAASLELASQIPGAQLLTFQSAMLPLSDAAPIAEVVNRFLAERQHSLPPVPPMEPLTTREREVVQLLAKGMTNQQIADSLVISHYTVARHVSNIFAKTGTANRTQAALRAMDH